MTFREIHWAQCSSCGDVDRTDDGGTFIDSFFLPDMCAACGNHMAGRYSPDEWPHWKHVIIKQEWQPPLRTRNPLSWLRVGRWVEVDRWEMRA